MERNYPNSLWVVVEVQSGIPVTAEGFLAWEPAEQREKYLRERMNPENDEIGVFEIPIPDPAHALDSNTGVKSS